jgi:hypothetical protein
MMSCERQVNTVVPGVLLPSLALLEKYPNSSAFFLGL